MPGVRQAVRFCEREGCEAWQKRSGCEKPGRWDLVLSAWLMMWSGLIRETRSKAKEKHVD